MRVCFFEASDADEIYLRKRLPEDEISFFRQPFFFSEETLCHARGCEAVSVFVHSQVTDEAMDALPHLKIIATRSTGYDHIDLAAAQRRGILVANVPTYGENTVAEHTFALILALSRNIHRAYLRTSSGDFNVQDLQGFDLKGRTIGVIGTGHIGLHVIRIAKGFDMKVIAYDARPDARAADILDFSYADLADLLAASDIVTLHAPLNASTRHLIGAHNIELFKPGAILINTARGGLVDTTALLSALDSGFLAGAGLDVIEGEEILSEEKQLFQNPNATEETLRAALRFHALLRRPDIVFTPHIGFDSVEAVERILNTTVENLKNYRRGTPQNIIRI